MDLPTVGCPEVFIGRPNQIDYSLTNSSCSTLSRCSKNYSCQKGHLVLDQPTFSCHEISLFLPPSLSLSLSLSRSLTLSLAFFLSHFLSLSLFLSLLLSISRSRALSLSLSLSLARSCALSRSCSRSLSRFLSLSLSLSLAFSLYLSLALSRCCSLSLSLFRALFLSLSFMLALSLACARSFSLMCQLVMDLLTVGCPEMHPQSQTLNHRPQPPGLKRRSASLLLCDPRVIPTSVSLKFFLGIASHFCGVAVPKLRTDFSLLVKFAQHEAALRRASAQPTASGERRLPRSPRIYLTESERRST